MSDAWRIGDRVRVAVDGGPGFTGTIRLLDDDVEPYAVVDCDHAVVDCDQYCLHEVPLADMWRIE